MSRETAVSEAICHLYLRETATRTPLFRRRDAYSDAPEVNNSDFIFTVSVCKAVSIPA